MVHSQVQSNTQSKSEFIYGGHPQVEESKVLIKKYIDYENQEAENDTS